MNDQRAERSADGGPFVQSRDEPLAAPATSDAVLASISDGIIALDNAWRLVYVNEPVKRVWRSDIGALIGKPIEEVLDINPDNPFRAIYTASKLSGEPVAFTGFSEVFGAWVNVRGYPHPGGYTILFRNESDEGGGAILRRERERETIRSINQRIFDTSLDLILVVDGHGDFLRVSPSSRAILGYRAGRDDRTQRDRSSCSPTTSRARATRCAWRAAASSRATSNAAMSIATAMPVPLAWTGIWSEPDRQYFFIGRDMTRAHHARGPAAPGAEDGGGRPAHRRRRARLQQHPHRHHRHDRAADRCRSATTRSSRRSCRRSTRRPRAARN